MNMISKLFGNDVALDLGTANMRVWVRGEGLVLDEPTAVAVQEGTNRVLAIGEEAKGMLGSTPGNIAVVRPIRAGAVQDVDIAEKLIRHCLAAAGAGGLRRPRVVIAAPLGIKEAEKAALRDAALKAGAREVFMLETPMAAALGAGLPVTEPAGNMVVDIGAGTTEIGLVSLAGIVKAKGIPVGGDEMNEAIVAHLRDRHGLLVGERTAEELKMRLVSAHRLARELECEVKGLDAAKGRPRTIAFDSGELRAALAGSFGGVEEALAGPLGRIEEAVVGQLKDAPPQIAVDLVERGFVLTGAGALMPGLDERLARATSLRVRVADDPAHAVIRGMGAVLDELDTIASLMSGR